ncbi:MAG: RNA 3'-terminal phosphate cyclase [Methanobacteriota archaeon]
MITVDGAHGEGGGQILRTAVALSALTGQSCRVVDIRSGRPNPGLAAQHVTAIRAVADLCSAAVEGIEVGSKEIVFRPGTIGAGRHTYDVGTAGSATLVLQACLPVVLQAPGSTHLRIIGGTDVKWSPPVDYFAKVFLPLLRRCGGQADLLLVRRGYYPRGGGAVEVLARPATSRSPFRVPDQGRVTAIRGVAHVSNLSPDISKRMRHAAMRRLHGRGELKIEERVYAGAGAVGQGGALVVWAETENTVIGSSSLAERGKSSERVGEEAATSLAAELDSGATLDVHAADQLLVYLAQVPEPSEFYVREASHHLRTMAWLLPQFLDRGISVEGRAGRWLVRVSDPRN